MDGTYDQIYDITDISNITYLKRGNKTYGQGPIIPTTNTIPKSCSRSVLRQATVDVADIMKYPQKYISKLTYGDTKMNALIYIAQIVKRAIPLPSPINTTEPTVYPIIAPIKNNIKEPRVSPMVNPATDTTPMQNNITEPRVNLVVSPVPYNNLKSCTTSSKNFQNNLAKRVIIVLKQDYMCGKYDPYTKVIRPKPFRQTRHLHFARSRISGFLAQDTIQINKKGIQQHITNHAFNVDTNTKQSIENLLTGQDTIIWKSSLSNEFNRLAQVVGKKDP